MTQNLHPEHRYLRYFIFVIGVLYILVTFSSCSEEPEDIPLSNERVFIDFAFEDHEVLQLYIGINGNACAVQLEKHRVDLYAQRTINDSLVYHNSWDIGNRTLYGERDTVTTISITNQELLPIDKYLFTAVINDIARNNCNYGTMFIGSREIRWQL